MVERDFTPQLRNHPQEAYVCEILLFVSSSYVRVATKEPTLTQPLVVFRILPEEGSKLVAFFVQSKRMDSQPYTSWKLLTNMY
jgi:hypothetical protein